MSLRRPVSSCGISTVRASERGCGLLPLVWRAVPSQLFFCATLEGRAHDAEGDPGLVARIGHTLAPLAQRVGGLVLTGGDTARGVLRAWRVTGIDLVEEIEPGVVLSMSAGAHALPVVTKSGSF